MDHTILRLGFGHIVVALAKATTSDWESPFTVHNEKGSSDICRLSGASFACMAKILSCDILHFDIPRIFGLL